MEVCFKTYGNQNQTEHLFIMYAKGKGKLYVEAQYKWDSRKENIGGEGVLRKNWVGLANSVFAFNFPPS